MEALTTQVPGAVLLPLEMIVTVSLELSPYPAKFIAWLTPTTLDIPGGATVGPATTTGGYLGTPKHGKTRASQPSHHITSHTSDAELMAEELLASPNLPRAYKKGSRGVPSLTPPHTAKEKVSTDRQIHRLKLT